jgi:putative mobilization protein
MISKISSSENLAGALGYNFKKVVSGEASVLLAEGLYEPPDSAYTLLEVLSDMQALIPPKISHDIKVKVESFA